MLPMAILAVGLLTQANQVTTPTMRFTNNTQDTITVRIYTSPGYRLAASRFDVAANKTGSIPVGTGNFEVVARNRYGSEARSKRTMAPNELDWMDFNGIYAGKTRPRFTIGEHPKEDAQAKPKVD